MILSPDGRLGLPPLDVPVRTARLAASAETFHEAIREHILNVLRETNGVIAGPHGAAARLGLKRTTLQSKMEKLGIAPEHLGAVRARRPAGPWAPPMQV